jgi:hypothetical protein
MKVVFFPNGRSCWEVNAYLVHCRRLGLTVAISTYASELSLLVRFLYLRRLELREIDDDHLIEFADWLVVRDESSARHINRILSRVLAFIGWAECISLGPFQIGRLGEQAIITVERRVVRTKRLDRVSSDRHAAMLPSGAKRVVRPMPLEVFLPTPGAVRAKREAHLRKESQSRDAPDTADTGIRREELV